ncbi:MAG TPA: LytTR family DNA-binding domain-containing protein [Flavisolibacter sp.]|nr:LytTR family DNA-binding domain-containing protein [Flavisolibacter sp.]
MKVLIVEDENLLAKQLTNLITTIEPLAEILGRTTSIQNTAQWLMNHPAPDLIFMDIELADGQCFEIFNQTTIKTPVIFTTAYDEYALQAFKVNSVDYLLKPIKESELRTAINKYKDLRAQPVNQSVAIDMNALINQLKRATPLPYKDRFLVKTGQKMASINTNQIAYFCAKNTLNFIVTKDNKKHVIDYTLDEIEDQVDPKHFFRANRQYILAHDVISHIHSWFNGKLKVELSSKTEEDIIISRDKAPLLKSWMGE